MRLTPRPPMAATRWTSWTTRWPPPLSGGWCDTCGSSVLFRYVADRDTGYLELSPGLFENAGGARLTRVVYADRHPDGYWLEGAEVAQVSQKDYEAGNPHLNEEC